MSSCRARPASCPCGRGQLGPGGLVLSASLNICFVYMRVVLHNVIYGAAAFQQVGYQFHREASAFHRGLAR